MCLGTVVRVTGVLAGGWRAECEAGGVSLVIGTQLVGPVSPGEHLLVHAGYALAKVDEAAAEAGRRLLEELVLDGRGASGVGPG